MQKRQRKSSTREELCGCGALFITTIFNSKGEIADLLIHFGKAGGCASATTAAVKDLISVAIEGNIPIQHVVKALKGHSCFTTNKAAFPPIPSCIEAISDALESELKALEG